MPEPEPLSVDDALDRLVKQFSDAMAFFRELIQNAIDAGSEEVEVGFEHRDGRMIVRVDDWGTGMTREIIDSRLTRLFSSSKDGDRTKIGKFGIGFVSVFAIEPEAISIDTSREGEHWRVLFDERRRFSLIRRDEPVEGTKIAIYKRASKAEFEQFKTRAVEVVRYWCRHVAADIRVDGQQINEPFELGVPLEVRREHEDELLVVGHPRDGVAFAGFYNRGLTLVEEQLLPGIAFKASSPNLEHTLTRDDVIREAGFERLMARVHALIADELCEEVFEQLDTAIRAVRDPVDQLDEAQRTWLEYLWSAALHHVRAEHVLPSAREHALFRSPSGALLVEAAVRKPKQRAVIVAQHGGPLSEALERAGEVVVWLPEWSVRGRALLDAIAPRTVEIDEWCTALPPRDSEEAVRWQVLARAVALLLDDWGAKIGAVQLGHLDYPHSRVADRVAITQAEFGEATPLAEAGVLGTGLFASRRVVVLNADHPTIRTSATLAQSEPELAAYLAVKAFLLDRDAGAENRLDHEAAEQLAIATHDRRLMRVGIRT